MKAKTVNSIYDTIKSEGYDCDTLGIMELVDACKAAVVAISIDKVVVPDHGVQTHVQATLHDIVAHAGRDRPGGARADASEGENVMRAIYGLEDIATVPGAIATVPGHGGDLARYVSEVIQGADIKDAADKIVRTTWTWKTDGGRGAEPARLALVELVKKLKPAVKHRIEELHVLPKDMQADMASVGKIGTVGTVGTASSDEQRVQLGLTAP